MRYAIVFFVFVTLVSMFQSCGKISDDTKPACCFKPIVPSDPEFSNYIIEFEHYSRVNTSATPIYFADLKEGIAGLCHYFRIGAGPIRWGYIEIDRSYWQVISEYQRINLIFHELGHCVLGRDHTPAPQAPLECPTSFMHSSVMSTYCIEKNYSSYIEEMFP